MPDDYRYPTQPSRDPLGREIALAAMLALLAAFYTVPIIAAADVALWFTPFWHRVEAAMRTVIAGGVLFALMVAAVAFIFAYRRGLVRKHRSDFRHVVCNKGMRSLSVLLLAVGAALAAAHLLIAEFAVVPVTLMVFGGVAIFLCLIQSALPLPARPRDLPGGGEGAAVDPADLEDKRFRWRFAPPSGPSGRAAASEPRDAVLRINKARCRELASRSGLPCSLDSLRDRVTDGVTPEIHQLASQLDRWEQDHRSCAYDSVWHIASFIAQFRCESHSCAVRLDQGGEVVCPYPVEVLARGTSPSPVGLLVLAAAVSRALTHRSVLVAYSIGGATRLALGIEAPEGPRGDLIEGHDCNYYFCAITGCEDDGTPKWSVGERPGGVQIEWDDPIEGLRGG